jgi:anaerobic ribonucleoside-triphosphate reductase
MLFSAFGRDIFHPRPQDGVFRCAFNKKERQMNLKALSLNQPRIAYKKGASFL